MTLFGLPRTLVYSSLLLCSNILLSSFVTLAYATEMVDEPLGVSKASDSSETIPVSQDETATKSDLKERSTAKRTGQKTDDQPQEKVDVEETSPTNGENDSKDATSSHDSTHTQSSAETESAADTENSAELGSLSADALEQNADAADGVSLDSASESLEQAPLVLLDASVAPGKADILTWQMESSFQNVAAPVSVLVLNGVQKGPTLCLTAAIHGDELNGIEVVRRVVNDLEPKQMSGAVIGIPIVNLEGFKRASRYLPDRRDLNRYFPGQANGSYASRVAHSFFSDVVRHCDFLFDLHTGSMSRTNLPQVRANLSDPAVADFAEKLGSIVILQSRGGEGTLRRAATDAGIPAVTFEAGAPNNLQKEAVEQGVATVISTLSALGITNKSRRKRNAEPTFYRSKWVRARDGGILYSKVELGDNVKKGSVLGLLSNPINNTSSEILSPTEGRVIGMALNQVMYPGFAAYHIGLKSSMVEAAHPIDDETGESFDYDLYESEEVSPPSELDDLSEVAIDSTRDLDLAVDTNEQAADPERGERGNSSASSDPSETGSMLRSSNGQAKTQKGKP